MIRFYNPANVQFTSKEGEVKIYLNSELIEYVTGLLLNIDSDVVEGYANNNHRIVSVVEISDITSVKFHDGTVKKTLMEEMSND